MGIKKHFYSIAGMGIIVILLASYFINIEIDSGSNYITNSPLLGVIIFYNPFILGIYILAVIILIRKGMGKNLAKRL